MRHPKRALVVALIVVTVLIAGAYWVVRGIPLKGGIARGLEGILSGTIGLDVAFKDARLHPPGVVTIRGFSAHEKGEPPVTVEIDALRVSATPWDWKKEFDLSARGVTFKIGEHTFPKIPRIKTQLRAQAGGVAWDEIEVFLPLFGLPAHGVFSSGYLKTTARPGEPRLVEYKTDIELEIRAFGVQAHLAGDELSAELKGRVGYGSDDMVPLACSLGFGDGVLWIDPFRLGTGPELEVRFDMNSQHITVSKTDGAVKADIALDLAHDRLDGEILLEHWMLGQTDLVSRNEVAIEWGPDEEGASMIRGKLDIPDLVVNLRPVDPLHLVFELEPSMLILNRLTWGESYQAKGTLDLKTQDLYLVVELDEVPLRSRQRGLDSSVMDPTGLVDGTVVAKGPLGFPQVEGDIVVSNGRHPKLGPFDSMNIHFKGAGSRWELYDSSIYKETGSFLLTGHIGLDSEGLYKHFEVHGHEGVIVLGGWDVSGSDENAIVGDKELGDRFKVNFKAYLEEASGARDERDEFGVEYNFSKEDSLMMRMRGEEQLMGLQRKKRF